MQILITHGRLARSRVLQFQRWHLVLAAAVLALLLMLLSGALYHFVLLKAAREGWPVVSAIVRLVAQDDSAERDRVMRDNLDAIAERVGRVQAKLVKLEAMGERVQGLAGAQARQPLRAPRPAAAAASTAGARGGPFVAAGAAAPSTRFSLGHLQDWVTSVDEAADFHTDFLTLIESRLLESRLRQLMVPSTAPVEGPVGSGFGFRLDPFNGRSALHTGLDFPGEVGTAIHAAAFGLVLASDWHPEYGRVLEIDHGNGLVTRYAHCSAVDVAVGALVQRGQQVARVGTSGRSTGAHLHFEVLVDGVPQDPARFLTGPAAASGPSARR